MDLRGVVVISYCPLRPSLIWEQIYEESMYLNNLWWCFNAWLSLWHEYFVRCKIFKVQFLCPKLYWFLEFPLFSEDLNVFSVNFYENLEHFLFKLTIYLCCHDWVCPYAEYLYFFLQIMCYTPYSVTVGKSAWSSNLYYTKKVDKKVRLHSNII